MKHDYREKAGWWCGWRCCTDILDVPCSDCTISRGAAHCGTAVPEVRELSWALLQVHKAHHPAWWTASILKMRWGAWRRGDTQREFPWREREGVRDRDIPVCPLRLLQVYPPVRPFVIFISRWQRRRKYLFQEWFTPSLPKTAMLQKVQRCRHILLRRPRTSCVYNLIVYSLGKTHVKTECTHLHNQGVSAAWCQSWKKYMQSHTNQTLLGITTHVRFYCTRATSASWTLLTWHTLEALIRSSSVRNVKTWMRQSLIRCGWWGSILTSIISFSLLYVNNSNNCKFGHSYGNNAGSTGGVDRVAFSPAGSPSGHQMSPL